MNLRRGIMMSGMAAAMLLTTALAANAGCCDPCPACCAPEPVCCAPPPPVAVTWCVQDPCDPCATYEVTACVPACCAGEVPSLHDWRHGIFGRKVLTYKFAGCGHCVDVVITCFRGAIAR